MAKRKLGNRYYTLHSSHQSKESAELKAKFLRKMQETSVRVIKGGKSRLTRKQIWQVWVRVTR